MTKVQIIVEGGIITKVISDAPIQYVILDKDTKEMGNFYEQDELLAPDDFEEKIDKGRYLYENNKRGSY